jgi:hypothetical protein
MERRKLIFLVASLVLGLMAADAVAQATGRRPGGRRILGALRGQQTPAGALPAPSGTQPTPNGAQPAAPVRQPGQLLRNLGGVVQGALQDGTLDPLLDKATSPTVQPGVPVASPLGATSNLKPRHLRSSQPFTADWYAGHPHAWKYASPGVDAWTVATFASAAAWLGVNAAPPLSLANGENVFTDASVASQTPPTVEGDYLPLGVFGLAPAGAQDPSAVLQLAVSKSGEIQGNYLDVITGQDLPLSGTFDKQTQLATIKLATPSSAEFEISLVSLTRTSGSARVRFENGESLDWSLVRFELAPPANK